MTTRARLQNANDSKSLWNYTLSPGWSPFDAHILRLAVMKYGCGAWRNIGRHFPLKNCNQLNLQTQRLFGQQALAEFQKVHIDPHRIRQINDKKEGFRKNQCLINTGNNLTTKERDRRRTQHIANYGIPKEIHERLQIPVVLDPPKTCANVIDDIEKLREMYRCVYDIDLRMKQLKENKGKNAANIKVKSKQKNKVKTKTKDNSNKEKEKKEDNVSDDVEMVEKAGGNDVEMESRAEVVVMDDDVAMAMALSASMEQTNINTPKPNKGRKEKKDKKDKKDKKKSTRKKAKGSTKKRAKGSTRKSRKRKNLDNGDEEYDPEPAKKRVKTK